MNIQESLARLRASGMTDAAIGAAIGAPQSIVCRIRNGKHNSTSFERGSAIHELVDRVLRGTGNRDAA